MRLISDLAEFVYTSNKMGYKLIVHNQNEVPFMETTGNYIPSGMHTYVAFTKVNTISFKSTVSITHYLGSRMHATKRKIAV